MGENTKIEWAHHTSSRQRVFFSTTLRFGNWLQMNFLMAVLAKKIFFKGDSRLLC